MKTPMQMLIEKYNEGYDSKQFFIYFITNKTELLEEEKREILDAWNDGFYGLEAPETQSAEQYYNEKYNQ